jgi:nicotinate-nucleotide pyrophosphorylase (carboxylating)
MELASEIERNVAAALTEDIGSGDLTAQLIPADRHARAVVISRVPAVICGAAWFNACMRKLDPQADIRWTGSSGDGNRVQPDQLLCTVSGNARALLSAERCALNFLQMLSGVATATRRYVDAIKGRQAQIVDTRKTLPGLRIAEKYAVRVGGGTNHRLGLYDGILIKENHLAAAGGISAAFKEAQRITPPGIWIQIEVETLEQFSEALAAGANMILLDNMNLEQLRQAVKLNAGQALLEASGGITLENVRVIAETGVDRISIGSLTKDVQAVDLSMRFDVSGGQD